MTTIVNLVEAAQLIKEGGVVAYPTEYCFGLGCDPRNYDAVKRILDIKNRPEHKGLILIANELAQLTSWLAPLTNDQVILLKESWPAANTWLIEKATDVPRWLSGDSNKIAVRVPGHDVARKLCELSDSAIVSTSANRSGQPAITDYRSIIAEFADQIDGVIAMPVGDNDCASIIRDMVTQQRIR